MYLFISIHKQLRKYIFSISFQSVPFFPEKKNNYCAIIAPHACRQFNLHLVAVAIACHALMTVDQSAIVCKTR